MQPLRVTLLQGVTRWHDAAANRAYYGELARRHVAGSDLCVLPETFLSGFTNDAVGQAVDMDGEDVQWMRALAAETGTVLTGSLVVTEAGQHFNRLLWVQPDGHIEQYDKRHLFRMAREHERYAAGGRQRLVTTLRGWRICPQVCYDLRFPVWTRNRHDEDAAGGMDFDLLLFVANWPAPRRQAWRTLLRARAIENLCYTLGVNRVGVDGNELPYAGDSAVIDPLGEALVDLGSQEQALTVTLDPAPLLAHRQRFPAWMDADRFELLPGAGR